ncbi:hypothetical protein BGZ73_006879 [Actinomortierella ambigua]|nr:hypothetical protein BGZ73_006879 [Actinomortierella ambigua]
MTTPVTLGTNGSVLIAGGLQDNPGEIPYEIYSFDLDQSVKPGLSEMRFYLAREMGLTGYGVVWSEYMKRAVYFGGRNRNYEIITTYDPASETWEAIATFGHNKNIVNHCMAITDDGKKVLMYGGGIFHNTTTVISSEFFILDLETKVWTELPKGSSARKHAACTVAGDYFLVWGDLHECMGSAIYCIGIVPQSDMGVAV